MCHVNGYPIMYARPRAEDATSQRAAYISMPPISSDLKPRRVPFVFFLSSSFTSTASSSSSSADQRVSFYRDCISINASSSPMYTSVHTLSISVLADRITGIRIYIPCFWFCVANTDECFLFFLFFSCERYIFSFPRCIFSHERATSSVISDDD